jgi:hypothetical protein
VFTTRYGLGLLVKQSELRLLKVKHMMISGFRYKADEICPLLGYYAAYDGNSFPPFRVNLSVQSLTVKNSKKWHNVPVILFPYVA